MSETGKSDEPSKMSERERKAGGNTASIAPDSVARFPPPSDNIAPIGLAATGQSRSTAATMIGDSIMVADLGSGTHQTIPLYKVTSKEHRQQDRLTFTPTEEHVLRGLRESTRVEEQVGQRIKELEALKAKKDEEQQIKRRPN